MAGFFTATETTSSKSYFVNLGGDSDGIFRTIAAGIMGNLTAHEVLINKLLASPCHYFRWPKPSGRVLTIYEQINNLIKQPSGMTKIIYELAYLLRQYAVDELCKNPWLYRSAFAGKNEQITPALMRCQTTWMDRNAIAALANSLALPIRVSVVEWGKELPLQLYYDAHFDERKKKNFLVIKSQGNHYAVKVTQYVEILTRVARQTIACLPKGVLPVWVNASKLEDIKATIKAHDERIVCHYERIVARLLFGIECDEIDKNHLLTIYINNINQCYSNEQHHYMGIEHGNQQFFDDAIRNVRGESVITALLSNNRHDKAIMQELVSALARLVSIGQMDENKIFSSIDDNHVTSGHY